MTSQLWPANRAEQLELFLQSHFGEVEVENLDPDSKKLPEEMKAPLHLVVHGDSVDATVDIRTLVSEATI